MSDRRVDLLIPSYRHFNSAAYHAITAMVNHTRELGYSVFVPALFSGGVLHWSRNDSIQKIRPKADLVLMIDDDMLPEKDSLVRLIKAGRPVISALTTSRSIPVTLNVKAYREETDSFAPISAIRPDSIVEGKIAAGTGFLLMRRTVIDRVREYYLSAKDWLLDHKPMLDRMGVTAEAREAERARLSGIRTSRFEAAKYFPMFRFDADHEKQREMGEDIYLCRRLLQLGIPVAVHTGVQVGHIGDYPYGPHDFTEDFSVDKTPTLEEKTAVA